MLDRGGKTCENVGKLHDDTAAVLDRALTGEPPIRDIFQSKESFEPGEIIPSVKPRTKA